MLTLDTVYQASFALRQAARVTDLIRAPKMFPDNDVFLKTENLQITGSFKVRGAYYKISRLTDEQKRKGVIACSAGNHAQGVALAAARQGIDALICLPEGAPISKVEATRSYGAGIELVKGVYDDAYNRALEIMKERAAAVYDFNMIFPSLFRKISESGMDLDIRYQPSWGDFQSESEIISYLEDTEERDLKMMTTTSGIHRDRFSVMSPSGPFAAVGSTGQIRLCSILFRISEARYFTKMTGKQPVLLIDDVLLELDAAKRSMLLSELDGYSQAFFTFLPRESYFGSERDALTYNAVNGSFSGVN